MTIYYGIGPHGLQFCQRWKCATLVEILKMAAAKSGRATHEVGVHKNLIIGLHSRVTPYFLCIGELNPFKPFSKISVHTTAP